jgi:hypothetical protein
MVLAPSKRKIKKNEEEREKNEIRGKIRQLLSLRNA